MPLLRAVPVMLSAGERTTLKKRVRGAKTPRGTGCARRSCWLPPAGSPMPGSPPGWASASIRSASGGAGSPPAAWTVCGTGPGPAGRGGSARRTGPRWSRWPASCPPPPACRWAPGGPPGLAAELTARGLASPMSASSVLRILAEHPVKPWQYQRLPAVRGQGEGDRGPVPSLFNHLCERVQMIPV